jgi:hypothetical protein
MAHGLDAADAAENAAKQIGAPEEVQNKLRWYINRGYSADEALNDISKTAPEWHDKIKQVLQSSDYKGRMYEVNIKANPEDFLDWDKPLSQQSEKAQKLWAELTGKPVNEGGRNYVPDGQDLVNLGSELPGPFNPATYQVEHSKRLREAGIPGIRYLDAMSRDGGAGTSNYVVFDDALIDILRKYANAPTGAAIPAGMEAAQSGDPQTLTTANILKFLRGQK